MKDCAYYQELISRLIDRELSAEEGEELAAHARECAECRAVYTAFSSLSGMLTDSMVEPPEELSENVMARLRREELRKQKSRPLQRSRTLAVAACAALVLIGGALAMPRLMRTNSAAPAAAPAAAKEARVEFSAASGAAPDNAPAEYAAEAPAAVYDDSNAAEATPIPVSDSFAAPATDTTMSEEQMISMAVARAEEPETAAEIVDVSGQGRGERLRKLLVGTQGALPADREPDSRFLLRFDVDGVSSQVLISVYGEKVFFISLSGEESDMVLADCSWSTLRGAIYY